MGFGILPGVPRPFLEEALPRLSLVSDLGQKAGGKRYLSGWIDFDLPRWQAHFEEKWQTLLKLKTKYDPQGILNPGFIPLGSRE